ncbi:MAG: hypothetical protein KKD35_06355 [Elusimicrobia bacterium]|nr:hypothetical protein [Elusimicrobiota bacterium]
MKKIIISIVALGLFSGQGFSQTIESMQIDFVSNISDLNIASVAEVELSEEVRIDKIKSEKVEVKLAPVAKAKKTKGEYISLSDYVNLSGSGFLPSNGGYTTIYLTGWVTFRDMSGKITSNQVYMNERVSFWSKENQYISESVYVNKNIQLYKDGAYVGSTYVSGSIRVSGWPSSNYIRLDGSGYLRGSFYLGE